MLDMAFDVNPRGYGTEVASGDTFYTGHDNECGRKRGTWHRSSSSSSLSSEVHLVPHYFPRPSIGRFENENGLACLGDRAVPSMEGLWQRRQQKTMYHHHRHEEEENEDANHVQEWTREQRYAWISVVYI